MKVAIVGGRTYTNYAEMKTKMNRWRRGRLVGIDLIISGGARGADTLAERYAKDNNIPFIVYVADWDGLGKKAGAIRDEYIAAACDHLIAFPTKVSVGTWITIRHARRKKKAVTVYKVTGS